VPFAAHQHHFADAQQIARAQAQARRRGGDAVAALGPFERLDAEWREQRLMREAIAPVVDERRTSRKRSGIG
jgi:predicted ATPase